MKILTDLHQLDISHWQDIVENAIVYSLGPWHPSPDHTMPYDKIKMNI